MYSYSSLAYYTIVLDLHQLLNVDCFVGESQRAVISTCHTTIRDSVSQSLDEGHWVRAYIHQLN